MSKPQLYLLLGIVSLAANLSASEKISLKQTGELVAEAVVSPATKGPELAMQSISIPDDLEISLFASEPLLANPVAFTIDQNGRVYVAETYRASTSVIDVRAYPVILEDDLASRTIEDRERMIYNRFDKPEDFTIESDRVRVILDTDDDGQADISHFYAEGFNSPIDGIAAGVLARKDKVWLTNIPSLWLLEGIDENGVAAKRTELLRGFGVHFGFYGHDLHGLIWGPDGKLYFSIGDRGSHVVSQEGNVINLPDTGAVFRCHPDGSNFEVFATGLRNPQELAFDEYGNLFTGDNDCDNGDEERLVHLVEGGDSGWVIGHQYAPRGKAGMWMLENMWKPRHPGQPEFIIPPVCNTEDGPSGIAYYPGTGLTENYQGHIFMCHFKGSPASSGIQTYTVKPKGATFELHQSKKFIENCVPTDVMFGTDGKLYFSDWVSGWTGTGKGRIYALSHPELKKDPVVAEMKQLLSKGMEALSVSNLLKLLEHPDQRVRQNAQFELADRGQTSITALSQTSKSTNAPQLARIHALWAIGQLSSVPESKKIIQELLEDPDDEIRAQAAKLAGGHAISEAFKQLIQGLEDSSARVRFFSAQSLGKLANSEAVIPLKKMIETNNDEDLYIRHAAVMGLVGSASPDQLKSLASDSSRAVRLAALLAMRRLEMADVAVFLEDEDPDLVLEAARAILDKAIDGALPQLARLIDSPTAKTDLRLGLRVLNAHFRLGKAKNARALAQFSIDPDASTELRSEALHHLGDWPKPPKRDRIVGVYRPLEDRRGAPAKKELKKALSQLFADSSPQVLEQTIVAIGKLGMNQVAAQLTSYAISESNPTLPRLAAFNTLEKFKDSKLSEVLEVASKSPNKKIRLGILPILARLSPEIAAPALKIIIENGEADSLPKAFESLAKMDDPVADTLLLQNLHKLDTDDVPLNAQLELLEAANEREDERIKSYLAARDFRFKESDDKVGAYRFALEGGKSRSGRNVFNNHPSMACIRCHKLSEKGGEAGPDLTMLNQLKDRKYILESIIDPNAAHAQGFEMTIVTLTNGQTLSGIVLSSTDETLTLQLPTGENNEILNSDIAQRITPPSSMPDIYRDVLSDRELRDLVEFLATYELSSSESH
ncbi:HEAT repeat domain-containing protein [Puniceicoccaceae bacterium K14]|nr:HEAT repeat domain-containing protein [Puniceicoccaceae bacterium K14]